MVEKFWEINEQSRDDEEKTKFDSNEIMDAVICENVNFDDQESQIVIAQGNKMIVLSAETLEQRAELNHNPGKLQNQIYKMA